MAPKKAAKKGGKEGDEEDLSVENFWKNYKKKCVEYNCDVSKIIKGQFEKFTEEGDEIKKLHMWEELGWPGVKAIVDSLKMVNYPHLLSIRLWKTYCEDEGVRAICEFLKACPSPLLCLELLDNKVTHLGCEFIGKALSPGKLCPPVCILKLDHNNFGSKGMNNLLAGLQGNENLKTLSVAYCGIDHEASQGLFELLIYSKSKLEELILTGNNLRNEGSIKVLQGVSAAKELKKIYLADNQFNEDEKMLEAIKSCMTRNKTLAKYDFRNNDLKDAAVLFFIEMLGPEEEGKIAHVTEIEISERSTGKKLTDEGPPEVYTPYIKLFKDQLALNKPKKGKKGGKKKGKKK